MEFCLLDQLSQIQEDVTQVAIKSMASSRKDGNLDLNLLSLVKNVKPQTDESKQAPGDEVTDAVDETVSKSVRRRKPQYLERNGDESSSKMRRRSVEEGDDEDESAMSIPEVQYNPQVTQTILIELPRRTKL